MPNTRGFLDWLTNDSMIGRLWNSLNGQGRSNKDSRGNDITSALGTGNRDTTTSSIDSIAGIQSKGISLIDELKSLLHAWTGAELTGAQREQNLVNEQMAQNAFQREMDFYGQRYQMGVQDMEAAGLNPALMYQGNGLGASTVAPSANGQSLMQSQGLSQILNLAIAQKQLDIEKYRADTERIGTNSQVGLNESIAKWNESRNKGQMLANEITELSKQALVDKNYNEAEFIKKHGEQLDALKENLIGQLTLIDAQSITEQYKAGYYLSQAMLNSANTDRMYKLTPILGKIYNNTADLQQVQKDIQDILMKKDADGDNFYDYVRKSAGYSSYISHDLAKLSDEQMNDAVAHFLLKFGFTGNGLTQSGMSFLGSVANATAKVVTAP